MDTALSVGTFGALREIGGGVADDEIDLGECRFKEVAALPTRIETVVLPRVQ